MAVDRNDRVVGGPTTIVVIDNDGMCIVVNLCEKFILVCPFLLCMLAEAELIVSDDTVMINEGETTMVCVNITNGEQIRERHITPMFIVSVGSNLTGKCDYCMIPRKLVEIAVWRNVTFYQTVN